MARLPIIQINDRYYYRDKRLQQLRAIDNYLDTIEWNDIISAVGLGGFALIWEMPESFPSDEVLNKAADPDNMGPFSVWEDVVQHVDKWLEKLPEAALSDESPDKDIPGAGPALQNLIQMVSQGDKEEHEQEPDHEQEGDRERE